jgi:predicted ATPase
MQRIGEDAYGEALATHHTLVRECLREHDGDEEDTQGDAFFATFKSARSCVAAAVDINRHLESYPWAPGQAIRVRMGIHTGEAVQSVTGLVGLDIHRAARVAGVANGGQVLLSEAVASMVREFLPDGVTLTDLGPHRLKDLGRPVQIYQLSIIGLQSDFPTLKSLDNPVLGNNLPMQASSFIGRQQEMSVVRELVKSERLVTLAGAGGSGKTRLGIQVAAELLDGSGDGVWIVELAGISDPDLVVSAISSVLGVAESGGASTLDALIDALSRQQVLLLLDNCEHLIDACARVTDSVLRRCPRVHLLATSREPLGIDGEYVYRVPSLSLPQPSDDSGDFEGPESSDAVMLFVERARSHGSELSIDSRNVGTIVDICSRLDCLPLAIELAAARMGSLGLDDLQALLDRRFRLLTGGSRNALERQQTLRATVMWSYSLLNDSEKAMLRVLSVFVDGFDLAAAQVVCSSGEISGIEVIDLVGSLVDKSLVVAESTDGAIRYRLLETIRQFAAEQVLETAPDEAEILAEAHCRYYLSLSEEAMPQLIVRGQGSWFKRLDAEQGNIRRAIEYSSAEPVRTELALRFSKALRYYWAARLKAAEAYELLAPLLVREEAREDPGLYVEALLSASAFARTVDNNVALELGTKAVVEAERIGDERLTVWSRAILGAAYFFAGDVQKAAAIALECVERARALGDDLLLAETMVLHTESHLSLDPRGSDEVISEALGVISRSGNMLLFADLSNNAGVLALAAGDLERAREHLASAAQALEESGISLFHVKINLGLVKREQGDVEGAASDLDQALRITRRSGNRFGLAYSSLGIACIASDLERLSEAGQMYGVAQAFLDETSQSWLTPYLNLMLESIEKIKEALGEDAFDSAFTKGMSLDFPDAMALAQSLVTSELIR